MLRHIAENLWVAEQKQATLGVEYGARMTVIRLKNQELIVISPIRFTPDLLAAVKDLGVVAALIAPNSFHHLFMKPWTEAFPNAKLYAVQQLKAKRPDLQISYIMNEGFKSPWPDEVSVDFMEGGGMYSEAIFYHHVSQTLILTDLCFNIHTIKGFFGKTMLKIYGVYQKFGPSKAVALLVKRKDNLVRTVERIAQWDAKRIIVAHGDIYTSGNCSRVLLEAFRGSHR